MAGHLGGDVLVHAGEETHHWKGGLAERRRAELFEDVLPLRRRRDDSEQIDVRPCAEECVGVGGEVGGRM